jgi:DNA invertase Pin-like site-specific DNA recombinase
MGLDATVGPVGKMVVLTVLMVAEMELGFIKARQIAGIAKAKGFYRGRQSALNRDKVRELCSQWLGATEIG